MGVTHNMFWLNHNLSVVDIDLIIKSEPVLVRESPAPISPHPPNPRGRGRHPYADLLPAQTQKFLLVDYRHSGCIHNQRCGWPVWLRVLCSLLLRNDRGHHPFAAVMPPSRPQWVRRHFAHRPIIFNTTTSDACAQSCACPSDC